VAYERRPGARRWVFFINVSVGAILIAMAAVFLRRAQGAAGAQLGISGASP
jgi:hypothetical protein